MHARRTGGAAVVQVRELVSDAVGLLVGERRPSPRWSPRTLTEWIPAGDQCPGPNTRCGNPPALSR
jgi:hypothetical protein